MRKFARANGPEIVRATADTPELLYAIHNLTNVEIREAAINAGIDVGQKHVGSRMGLGEAQVGRQELIGQMLERGVKPAEIPELARQPMQTVPVEQLKEGDTFVDKTGEPRRIVEITPRGKIRTADGTALTYNGAIEIRGELNSMRAQLARGGKFIPQAETASSVPLMEKPPAAREGLSTLDVAKLLNRFTRSMVGALSLAKATAEEMVGRAREAALEEAKYQLAQKDSGTEWYKADIADHDRILQNQLRPELKDPAKLSIFKFAEAILSLSNKPYNNVKVTLPAWDFYRENGVFNPVNPTTGRSWGPAAAKAYGNAFRYLNQLIDEHGEAGASEWLLADHPTSELRAYRPDVPGAADEMQPGAMILGDKRGPFSLNLHGREAAFTADRWVSRTWNRWMGTIQWDEEGNFLTDAPRNETERSLMKQAFAETAEELGLTTSQLQAVLWYYEQGLYRAMGVPKESGSFAAAASRLASEAAAVRPSPSAPSRLPPRTFSAPSRQPRAAPLR